MAIEPEEIKNRIPVSEIRFVTSRSAGPGGQNVNKVNTKVELRFSIGDSSSLSDQEKERIRIKLKNRINSEDILLIISRSERTQLKNRKAAEEKFYDLLASALTVKPKRKKTKPTILSTEKRLTSKKKRGEKKRLRKKDITTE